MGDADDLKALLAEIRDLQREHLTEYRRVTRQSLELQQRSVARQEQFGTLYRRIVIVGAALTIGILIIVFVLLNRILP